MNDTRRYRLERISERMKDISDTLNRISAEEQDALNHLPARFRQSPSAQRMASAVDTIDTASLRISEARDLIKSITQIN